MGNQQSNAKINKNKEQEIVSTSKNFPIVGIGASAGGLETFTELLRSLPANTGMAFVLVQHLDPKHASLLTELLYKATQMLVHEVEDGMTLQPNHVYVIPPNTNLAVLHGVLHLMPRTEVKGPHMPIDYFFRSLAEDQRSDAIGVVLSGTGSDGTHGLKTIKGESGITFAQSPESAKYDGMPRSAVNADVADFVLTPEGIAKELAIIGKHPYIISGEAVEVMPEEDGDILRKIFILIRSITGVDFTNYKQSTVKRRIARRMVLFKLEKPENYFEYLQKNPEEVQTLYDDILIPVTNYFREPEVFEGLKTGIFPNISKDKTPEIPIRVWVPGCSTGEEAYSIAIALLEFLENELVKPSIQIFATDISEKAIEKARRGRYPESISADVSPERLRRFFSPVEDGYEINRTIREMCVFAKHDLTRDPPFSRLDLISCRNVLIYFGSVLQKRVIPIFHYALNPEGFLLLGASETVGRFTDMFKVVDKKNKTYKKKHLPSRTPFEYNPPDYAFKEQAIGERPAVTKKSEAAPKEFEVLKEADRIMLSRYTPAGVVVNEDLEIVQFRGHVGPYLEPSQGRASLNLLNMIKGGLAIDLRTAIHKAKQTNGPIRKERLRIKADEGYRDINIEVVPIKSPSGDYSFMILFEDATLPAVPRLETKGSSGKKAGKNERGTGESEHELEQLRQELVETKDYLRTIVEEKEAANEELRAANEEIQSSNEELQSINEELETAKEELQSSNEELTTVNDELQNRNIELTSINDDLNNLLVSVNIPIVMLGRDLRIRRYTTHAEKLLNISPADVGRSIADIKLKIDVPELEQMVIEVVDKITIIDKEITDSDGRWYSLRIRPYKTIENKIDGAVITLVDIDTLKRVQHQIAEARNYAEAIVETVREPLIILNTKLEVISANRAFYRTFKVSPKETENVLIYEVGGHQWNIPILRDLLEEVLHKKKEFNDFEVEHDFPRIGSRTMLLNARRFIQENEGREMILLAVEDVTERKKAENAIKQEKAKAEKYVDIAGVMLVAIDTDQNVSLINKKGCQVLGYQKNEIIGKNWFDNFIPKRIRSEVIKVAARLLAGDLVPVEYFENPILTKSGEERLIAWNNTVLRDENGKIIAHLSSGEDITERRQVEEVLKDSEERFRAAVDTAGDVIISIDSQDKIVFWNRSAEKLFGYRAMEVIGKDVTIIVPKRYRVDHKKSLVRYLATGKRSVIGKTVELSGLCKDGSEFPLELSVAAWETSKGVFFTGIIRDITERKRAEEILRRAQELSNSLNEIDIMVHSTLDFEQIIPRVVDESVKVVGCESAAVILRRDDKWSISYTYGLGKEQAGTQLPDRVKHLDIISKTRQNIVVEDVQSDKRVDRQLMEKIGIRSFAASPLVVRNEVVGIFAFHYRSAPVSFSEAQIDFIRKVSAAVSLAFENSRLYDDEKQAKVFSDVLNNINTAITSTLDVNEILKQVIIKSAEALGSESAGVSLREDGESVIRYVYGDKLLRDLLGRRFTLAEASGFGTMAAPKTPLVIDDAYNDDKVDKKIMRQYGVRSVMVVPLMTRDQVAGGLFFIYHSASIKFNKFQIDFANKLSVAVSLTLENARNYEETQRSLSDTQTLSRVAKRISQTLELGEVLISALAEVLDALKIQHGCIYVSDDSGNLVIKAQKNLSDEFINAKSIIGPGEGCAGEAAVKNEIFAPTKEERHFACKESESLLGLDCLAAIPIVYRGNNIGVLELFAPVIRRLSEREREIVTTISAQLASALENVRLYTEERDIANTLQESLLIVPEKIEGINFGSLYKSSTVKPGKVGGDFYDIFELEGDRVGIIVGDVSGKGVEAAKLTALVKNTIKAYSFYEGSPAVILDNTNAIVRKNVEPSIFVTIFFGILNKNTGALTYCGAGHPPAIVKTARSKIKLLMTSSPALISIDGLKYKDEHEVLEKGDILILYTDGVTEARNDRYFFGEKKLFEFIENLKKPVTREIPQLLYENVEQFSKGKLADDIAILTVSLA